MGKGIQAGREGKVINYVKSGKSYQAEREFKEEMSVRNRTQSMVTFS